MHANGSNLPAPNQIRRITVAGDFVRISGNLNLDASYCGEAGNGSQQPD